MLDGRVVVVRYAWYDGSLCAVIDHSHTNQSVGMIEEPEAETICCRCLLLFAQSIKVGRTRYCKYLI